MLRDTAGREGDALIHFLCCGLFNPSVLWTPPLYFALQNTGEECGYIHCRRAEAFSALTPSPYGHSPYISSKTPRNATGHGRGRGGLTLSLLLPVFLTPPSYGHLPYILHYKTQGRRCSFVFDSFIFSRTYLNDRVLLVQNYILSRALFDTVLWLVYNLFPHLIRFRKLLPLTYMLVRILALNRVL